MTSHFETLTVKMARLSTFFRRKITKYPKQQTTAHSTYPNKYSNESDQFLGVAAEGLCEPDGGREYASVKTHF